MKRFLLYLLTVVSIVACSEGEPADNGSDDGGGNTPTTPTITLNKSSVSFDELADEESISFSTTADWIAEIVNDRADGWLSVTPQSGTAGDASITIKATGNDTPDERNASIRIKAGTASKTISVSQKQKDALTVTSSKFEVEAEGGEVKIEVKANIDFEYAIDESAQEWIKYEGTRAMKTSTLTFSVAENDDTEKREGKIAIKSGEFNEVVTIYQAGSEPSIVISQNEYVVSSDGETISVEVSSNVDVEIEMPADADWISENTTRATSTNTYRFDIQPNEDYDQRTAEIKFTNKENGLSETVKVVQTQKDALVVAKDSYTVDSDGGQLHIEVGHNVDFDIEIANNWITKVENTRAFVTETLVFNIAKNPTNDNREGTIIFKSKDGKLSQTVKVYQAQEDALIISKKDIVVSDEGGTISFELQTNVEFKVSEPDVDWLRPVVTRGLTTHTLHYEYDANSSYDSREAHIVVTNTKTNASETITITQAQKDAIVLAKDSYTVSSEGDHIEIEVGHNVDFDIEISNDWITKTENTRAFVTESIIFNIAKNPTNDNREGTIIFKSKDGAISQTVKVYQAQEDALIISKKDIVVSDEGGTISFELQTNVEFKVSDPDVDWLRPVVTRGLTTHTLHYEYDANSSYDSREAKIVVTDTKNNKSETITITQAQKDAIVLAKSEYEFGTDGGNLDFEIQTNVDVTVTISDNATDWIQQVETRALETKALYFNVTACSAEEDREGTITISGGNATQTITVKQSGLKEILEKEREALIAFYNATGGDNWTNNENWCSDKPVSEWYGVNSEVDEFFMPIDSKRVVSIRLPFDNLNGNIPNEIANLKELTILDLSGNSITGEIQQFIGDLSQLSQLSHLALAHCGLIGNIPEEIANLHSLKTLELTGNKLTGEIPEKISDLSQLKQLYLTFNLLSGKIPPSIGKLSKLEELLLSGNKLSGNIPKEIGSLTNLKYLNLSSNSLTGSIPSEITKLTQLEYLWLNRNELNGELPTDIGNMVALRELNLQFNQISGEIPNSLGNLKNLESLILSVNSISGTIPTSISGLENIGWLDLMGNQLSGEIPSEIGSLSKLKHLNLGGNKLCGEIPTALVNCVSLEDLRLFDNNLTGNIPKELGNIELLTVLSIGSNNFTGTIPKELSELDKLVELALDNNLLTGGIPEEFVNLKSLKYLYLSNNYLSGECSEDLSNFIYNLDYFELNQKDGYEIILNADGSVDYSMDGEVVTLQTHTKGNGASFVITMDGFTDKQIASGEVDVHIQRCYDALFAVEPYASFKDYFDVYVVYSVSKRSGIGNGSALGTEYAGDTYDLGIEKIEEYINKVPVQSSEIHSITILNDKSWRRDMCYWMPYGSISSASIGNYDEETPEDFVRTIHHEILGHGFGRLGDEYVETTDTTFSNYPEEEKQVIWDEHKRGWYLNVDVTNDPERVVWKDFLSNPNYASENIGIYEGALYYEKGAYRSTYTSIMRDASGTTFNAPSRWAIYKHIMEIAGEEYSLETFFEYDKKNLVQTRSVDSKSAQSTPIDIRKLGAKPVFLSR